MKLILLIAILAGAAISVHAETKPIFKSQTQFAPGTGIIRPELLTNAQTQVDEKGVYKFESTGFMSLKDTASKSPLMIYVFAMEVAKKGNPTRIIIEDVSEETVVRLVDDKTPMVDKKSWRAASTPQSVNETSTPWIYSPGASIRTYKVTIAQKKTADIILYQSVSYPAETKQHLSQ